MDSTTALLTLLRSKFGYEARNVTPSKKQLRVLGRLPNHRMGDWLVGMHHVHQVLSRRPGWSVDFSKYYFPRNGKIVYAWRLIFQSVDDQPIEAHFQEIANAFSGAPQSARGEVMEVALMGTSTRSRNASGGGKGAYTIGGSNPFMPSAARR